MDKPQGEHREQLNFWGIGITLGALILVAIFVDISTLREWVGRAGVWGPVVFMTLKASTIIIAPLSGGPLYPTVGLLFGFWPGILYTFIGDIIGVSVNFYLSRKYGQRLVSKFISFKEEGLLTKIISYISDAKGFFHACLTFFAMPELLAYAAGLSKLPYIKFVTIWAPIGIIPASILVLFGSIFGPESSSLLITFGIPLLGAAVLLTGGLLFFKGVMRK